MIFYVENAGKYGLLQDVPDYQLPKEAWTTARNIRPIDGVMTAIEDDKLLTYTLPNNTEITTYIQDVRDLTEPHWFIGGQTQCMFIKKITGLNLRSDLNGSLSAKWTGGVGTINVFNNGGADNPFQAITPSGNFFDLPNWPTDYKCKMMRPYRNFWVAGDINDAGIRFNQLIHWSAPSAPGIAPPDWDYSSTTSKSGRQDLADEGGSVVDAVTVGRTMYIYKEYSSWTMSLKGGVDVMQIDPFVNNIGIHAANHRYVLPNNQVFVVGPMGVIRHDSVGEQVPIFKNRLQRWINATIDVSNYKNGFVTALPFNKEVLYCFPSNGAVLPDTAIVWSWEDDRAFVKDLPNISAANIGSWDESADTPTIDELSQTINSYTGLIDSQVTGKLVNSTIFAKTGSAFNELHAMETKGTTLAEATLTRTGQLMDTDPLMDKLVRSVTPFVRTAPGVLLEISVGYQDELEGAVTWEETRTIDPHNEVKADFRVEGKIPCIQFKATGEWYLYGYAIDYDIQGRRQRNG